MMSVQMESKQPQWKDFPSVYLTVAELSLAPSSSSVEEGDMQIYLLESLEKHCPRLAFSEAGKTSQSHNKTGKVRGKYMHPSTHYWCFATVDFDSRKKRENTASFIGQHFVLITEPWETQRRRNPGKSSYIW